MTGTSISATIADLKRPLKPPTLPKPLKEMAETRSGAVPSGNQETPPAMSGTPSIEKRMRGAEAEVWSISIAYSTQVPKVSAVDSKTVHDPFA